MNDYKDLIENNTYWIFYDNKWSPVIVVIPYSNNDKYFKFFNGGIIECKCVSLSNIEPLVHFKIENVEVDSCKKCPNFEKRNPYSMDGFDFMIDWYCKKSNKMIQGAVEWHEESKINVPDWCEFKNTKL